MGILSWFRGESSKDIRLKQDISKYLVFPFVSKKKLVWLNKKAVVPENCALVFASKGKLLDILPAGEHTLGAVVLPKCSSKFKLYKLDKYGKSRTSFKGYTYFVNILPHKNFTFSTYGKLYFQNEFDGRFWANLSFEIDFEITNIAKFVQNLLMEFAYLRINESEDILEDWLSDFVSTELSKGGYHRDDFVNKKIEITERLKIKLEKLLLSVGLKLTDLRISEVELSKLKNRNKNPLKNPENEILEVKKEQQKNEETSGKDQANLEKAQTNRPLQTDEVLEMENNKNNEVAPKSSLTNSTWQGLEVFLDDDSDKNS